MASQSGGYENGRGGGGGEGDGKRRLKPKFSYMEQPPLLKQLKCILAEYPDGGQIVKELIQNAEDAGATTIKIVYDARPVNQEATGYYSKFFKGPALLLYNDGMFTEQDWKGIKMIYSSVKEDDRLKVGRFGLGFKSVFHITDFPSVISGNTLLLINPHEHASEVNAEFEVDHLSEYEGIDVSEFHNAFGESFQDVTTTGQLQGTIFRFPLRQLETPLSDNVYNERKVLDLFDAFKKEASYILLFLKGISNITLSVKKSNKECESIAVVELVNNLKEIQAERNRFKSEISKVGSDYNGSHIENFSEVHIQTTLYDENEVSCQSSQTWLVVSYFMGNNASKAFKKLIQDKSIGYSPYVGIAAPLGLTGEERCEGHEFCFLPLPKEGRQVTGLPFHVNGFFSLSQNRHHIKWATDEQQENRITDKNILWNQSLAGEALPLAYKVLLDNAIQIAKSRNLGSETIASILPLYKHTSPNWMTFVKNLFHQIKDITFLKVHEQSTWVNVDEACFATFSSIEATGGAEMDEEMKNHVVKSLLLMNQPYVKVSSNLFKTLCHFYGGIIDTVPQTVSSLLKKAGPTAYTPLPDGLKSSLIQFLLSANNYELLVDLKLIPLASKQWAIFKLADSHEEKLLLPSEAHRELNFPGLEDCFLEVPDRLLHHFNRICNKGQYNVKHQTIEDTVEMIARLLSKNGATLTDGSFLSLSWLKKVWSFFRLHVNSICKLPLVPYLRKGTWENPQSIDLIPLNKMIILKSSDEHEDLSVGLCNCLEHLSIIVLTSLPPWFPLDETSRYICQPSELDKLLKKIANTSDIHSVADVFNKRCPVNNRQQFRKFIASFHTDDEKLITLQKNLEIFYESDNLSQPQLVSMVSKSHRMEYVLNTKYPIRYPKHYLLIDDDIEHLVKRLGASRCDRGNLVELTIQQAMLDYSEQDRITFMKFFVDNFEELKNIASITKMAREVKFVKCKGSTDLKSPAELFDPTDPLLQNLLDDCFFPEDTHPAYLSILQRLGLNKFSGLKAEHVRSVAVYLDNCSLNDTRCNAKANAVMLSLCRRPQLLKEKCANGNKLKSELSKLRWVNFVKKSPASFPNCIPWFSSTNRVLCQPSEAKLFEKWHTIVGSVMPTVQCENREVINHFGWNIDPHVTVVVEQLELVKKWYNVEFKTEIVMIVKAAYEFLDKHRQESIMARNLKELVWCGHAFVSACKVVIYKTPDSIDLKPYLFFISEEMAKFAQLFLAFGCHQTQDADLLISVLKDVKKNKKKHQCGNDLKTKEDLQFIVRVLEKLGKIEDIASRASEVLIPVQTSEQGQLVLKPASECAYTDEEYMRDEEDEREFTFVHECITERLAKVFGIKSIAGHVLADAEGLDVEEWGQEEPLTTRLNSLLREGYKDGLSVPKELVQNADDANASVVKILYDERQNTDNMTRLLNKGMQACQGPALWFYNDASFTETDFQNIIKLNGATKKNDGGKIGKFGLGFCSVYNLTDVPCFFSGTTFVFFDPHRTYLRNALPGVSSGMKINLNTDKRDTQIRKYRDQFSPFQDVFGCSVLNEDTPFEGTLFRFPLRTNDQAKNSKIKKKAYLKNEVSKLLSMFIETAGDMLLFTQNVQRIEIYHLGPDGKPENSKLIFTMSKEIARVNFPSNTCLCSTGRSVLQTLSSADMSNISDVHVINIIIDVYDSAKSILQDSKEIHTECSWVVSWSSGKQEAKELASRIADRRALSLAAVAVPCLGSHKLQPYALETTPSGFHRSGRLFCFLPLPIESGLSIQLNACFDVTSDRRQLLSDSEDDMETMSHRWNKALLTDAAVCAFLQLLETIFTSSAMTEYYSIWPTSKPKQTGAFVTAMYTYIVSHNSKVFKGIGNTNLSFSQVNFIDPILRENKYIGMYCFALLSKFQPQVGKQIIDLPINILKVLKDCHKTSSSKTNVVDKAIIKEQELILTFLNSLQDPFWQNKIEMRNAFLSFSLKSESKNILEILRTKECIPTKPHGRLRKPGEMVSERSKVAHLFLEEDERFIQVNTFDFDIENKLKRIGMITDKLPEELLLDRCKFIEKKARSCYVCGYEFCLKMIQYFCRSDVQQDIQSKDDTLQEIQNSHIIPVLCKPHQWTLPWYSEQSEADVVTFSTVCEEHKNKTNIEPLCLGKPKGMYRQSLINIVCCIDLLVNEKDYKKTWFSRDALEFLGVKDSIHFPEAVRQFYIVISQYNKEHVDMFKPVISGLYDFLTAHLKRANRSEQTEMKEVLQSLSDSPVVFIDSDLVKASDVAIHVKIECRPYLYKLPAIYKSEQLLFEAFGVRPYFLCADVIEVLKQQKEKWGQSPCSEVDTICSLLKVLADSLEQQKCKYEDLKESHKFIVAPDADRILRPTSELVADEDDFISNQIIHVLNNEIPQALAFQLGVQSKKKKCRQNISRGIPFGQKEQLVTRLRSLLKAYPCDSGIMKELIQNADDAGATEICFITDFQSHEKDENYGCVLINEPSLCVFNNSSFTKQDMEGIHNLGCGSKGSDPTKTGQYGVGFNAVYHLTDLPSFMTVGPDLPEGGSVCIFDPLCNNIVDVTKEEPGIRSEVNGLRSDYPNMLLGFHENELLCDGVGTVFRFPLRQKESKLSSSIVTKDRLKEVLEELKKDMFDVLLFVKNVSCIKIMDISSGHLQEEYAVHLQMTKEDRRNFNAFNNSIKEYINLHKENNMNTISIPVQEVQYQVIVSDRKSNTKKWLLVQRCGFEKPLNDAQSDLRCALTSGNIGLLPVGGVALPLDDFDKLCYNADHNAGDKLHTARKFPHKNLKGRAFCFLPLPLKTGLPVHINGHFALDHEARRELWNEGYRQTWNNCILNNVVIPAWISGIEKLKTLYVNRYIEQCDSWSKINEILPLYHFSFPKEQTGQSYWATCVKFFYHTVEEHKSNLFPVVKKEKKKFKKKKFTISWFPVLSQEPHACGVFNVIEHYLPDQGQPSESFGVKKRPDHILSNIFKRLGMRLLHTPYFILETMKALEIKTDVSDPCYVLSFLHSFREEKGICKIGSMDKLIEETHFQNLESLLHVVRYIYLGKDVSCNLNGLPILLTADGILHQCSVDEPVLSSYYLDLLPKSKDLFLHRDLVPILPCNLEDGKSVVVDMTLQKFAELLPHSFKKAKFCSGLDVNWPEDFPVAISWSCRLFQFLLSKAESDADFAETLNVIGRWSFLPAVHQLNGQQYRFLIPIEKFHSLFTNNASMTERDLNKSLISLPLPAIDSLFSENMRQRSQGLHILFLLHQLCASTEKPDVLLRCLCTNKILLENIRPDLARALVAYFNHNLSVLQEKYGPNLKKDLKHLPLFLTSQGTVVTIQSTLTVCVIPERIPKDGVSEFAENIGLVLLQQNDAFKQLYEFLGLSFHTKESFYAETLLPSMAASMPVQHWKKHIEYIKMCCLLNNGKFMPLQQSIIDQLQNIPFINSKKANDFFYHEHPVFKCMLSESKLVPKEYRSDDWIDFLKLIGLVMEVDDNQFEQFANQIERNTTTIDDDTLKKSRILIDELLGPKQTSRQLFARIREIRFVVPFKVETSVSQYCSQHQDGAQLISFRGSTLEENWKLCWTCLPMIPEHINSRLNKDQRSCLGILVEMPLNHAMIHCRQVCVSLKTLLDLNRDNTQLSDFVSIQMDEFYEYFYRYLKKGHFQNELKHIPLVYIPQQRDLIQPDQVVVQLSEKDEIHPYIYCVPRHYSRYSDLFIALGGQDHLTCAMLASVLEKVYLLHRNNQVIGSDKGVVIKTLRLFFTILGLESSDIDKLSNYTPKLYLPNKAMVMCESKTLVVDNARYFSYRLVKNDCLNWFIDLKSVDINFPDEVALIKKIPPKLQPLFLKDIVTEHLCLDNMQVIEQSQKSEQLNAFLHSQELLEGLLRLIKMKRKDLFKPQIEEDIRSSLMKVQCVQVQKLPTILQLDGEYIQGSEESKQCHIKKEIMEIKFYFQMTGIPESVSYLAKVPGGVCDLILCAVDSSLDRYMVSCIVDCIETPWRIRQTLDWQRIEPYDLCKSDFFGDFPSPGTYVEERMLPFLVQDLRAFQVHEYNYVAMEFAERGNDNEKRTFKYVRILQRIANERTGNDSFMSQEYRVNCGEEAPITVKISYLYRFVRPSSDGQDRFGNEPQNEIEFEKCCHQVRRTILEAWNLTPVERDRIFQRLMEHWCDGTNKGSEFAKRVFNYICEIIMKLEQSQQVSEIVNNDTGKITPDTQNSFIHNLRCSVQTNSRTRVKNYVSDCTFYKTYNHRNAAKAVRPDIGEARRWLRQATNDYKAACLAMDNMEEVPAHNWTCYKCHQACEKAMKAVRYSVNANNVPNNVASHNLMGLAENLSTNLQEQARLIMGQLGDQSKLRYPDAVFRERIPSDMYDMEAATFAIKHTKRVLELAGEAIDST